MWHRIIVEIEADIGRLADLDDDALYQRVWVVRQSQQLGRFLGEGVADADIALSRTSPIRRHAAAPSVSLSIEVIQINKFAGREEARADVLNRSLNPAFLVAARHCDRARFVAIMCGELEQRRVEVDDIALTFQHGAAQIVIEEDTGASIPGLKRRGVTTQEVLQAGAEEEPQEDLARIAQHHNEGHQRTAGTDNGHMAEVSPIDLGLLARKAA